MIEAMAFTEKECQRIDPRCLLARIVQTGKKNLFPFDTPTVDMM
jgi:hypothetical protein